MADSSSNTFHIKYLSSFLLFLEKASFIYRASVSKMCFIAPAFMEAPLFCYSTSLYCLLWLEDNSICSKVSCLLSWCLIAVLSFAKAVTYLWTLSAAVTLPQVSRIFFVGKCTSLHPSSRGELSRMVFNTSSLNVCCFEEMTLQISRDRLMAQSWSRTRSISASV